MMQSATDGQSLRIAIDIGGTFTDGVIASYPEGRIWVAKWPTTPDDPGEAVSQVIDDLLSQVAKGSGGDTAPLAEIVHGTTLITNTLIERKGARTALVTTRGMGDALDIGREWRYDTYDLELTMPKPLAASDCRVEVNERLEATGAVLVPLTDAELARVVAKIESLGVESVAVSFLHSYANTDHEKQVEEKLRAQLPGVSVSLSSDLVREIKEYERTSTVTANAYVKPIVANYLKELGSRIERVRPGTPLRVMVSSGGFTSAIAGAAAPILLLESGPAAGVISVLNTARQHKINQVLAFDMGGTTAKACVAVDGEPRIAHSFECARVQRFKRGSGLPILIPSIELIEIGAGGGSIARCNRLGLLNVGPDSSGAVPGPVCYGRGGKEPTVTDADLFLGYLSPDNFLGGEMKLDVPAVEKAMARLGDELSVPPVQAAWGICNIVNENMASAARIHIAENGLDPRGFTMVATGGAGPVHVVEVAHSLRIPRVLVPIAAGAGSCIGMLAAPARVDRAWSTPQLLSEVDWADVGRRLRELRAEAEIELTAAGATSVEWTIGAEMRYYGQGAEVSVSLPFEQVSLDTGSRLLAAFETLYKKLYGRLVPNALAQIITWRLVGRAPTQSYGFVWGDQRATVRSAPTGRRKIYLPHTAQYADVAVYDRYGLPRGTQLEGPLILEERESTIVVALAADVTILSDLTVSIVITEVN